MKKLYFLFPLLSLHLANAQIELQSFEQQSAAENGLFGVKIDGHQNRIICSSGIGNSEIISKAHIFEKIGPDMVQAAMLEQPDPTTNDAFGREVALFGDYAAVAAPFHDAFSANSGAVYVYRKSGDVWSLLQKVTAPNPDQVQLFGSSICIHNGQLFVWGNPGTPQSAVYIFNLDAGNVTLSQTLSSSDSTNFGNPMAFEGDTFAIAYLTPGDLLAHNIATYRSIGGQWMLQDDFNIGADPQTVIRQIRLHDNRLHIATSTVALDAVTAIAEYDRVGNNWVFNSSFVIDPAQTNTGDNKVTDFDVSGDQLVAGMAAYVNLLVRRSPSVLYKKIGGQWSYQQTFYGDQADDLHDDRFGSQVLYTGNFWAISAAGDSSVNPSQGKVYYSDGVSLLGTARTDTEKYEIYPNPTQGKVNFKTGMPVEKAEVFSVTGHLLQSAQQASSVALDGLSAGMYLIRLTTADQSQTFKIIKN